MVSHFIFFLKKKSLNTQAQEEHIYIHKGVGTTTICKM